MSQHGDKPLVAIVGRPNVGKSTLYNRLVGGRPALVENVPGVTRDRRYGLAEFGGVEFRLVDTGGLDPNAQKTAVTAGIDEQARQAIDEAEIILLVIDARDGITPVDRDVARTLRQGGRPTLVVANKVDSDKQDVLTAEAYELGLEQVLGVSATHGRGVRELLDAMLELLPDPPSREEIEQRDTDDENQADSIRIAFLGRPNAGKSSLVNRLLGEERVLVHDRPGTTTDPVDTELEFDGNRYTLVDTAGVRKRARIDAPTEKIAVSMALGQLKRCNVVCLIIDAEQGASDQDAKLAGLVEEAGRALVIVANKSDLLAGPKEEAKKQVRERIKEHLGFASYAPIRLVSAKTGSGVAGLLDEATAVYQEHGKRIATSELNRFFEALSESRPAPTFKGKPVRIYYLTQLGIHPPTFALFANRPELVQYSYRRFLANQLRERFGFRGTPLKLSTRRRNQRKR